MKIRQGFVSNSSSSSFMIGIGVVGDWKKFNKWMKSLKTVSYPINIFVQNIEDVCWEGSHGAAITEHEDRWSLEAPVNDLFEVSVKKEDINNLKLNTPIHQQAKDLLETGKSGHHFATLCVGNDEGDAAFTNESGDDLDYNITLERFHKDERKIYDEFSEENGILFVDKTFGVARNG